MKPRIKILFIPGRPYFAMKVVEGVLPKSVQVYESQWSGYPEIYVVNTASKFTIGQTTDLAFPK